MCSAPSRYWKMIWIQAMNCEKSHYYNACVHTWSWLLYHLAHMNQREKCKHNEWMSGNGNGFKDAGVFFSCFWASSSSWMLKTCDTAPGSTIVSWHRGGNVWQWRSPLFGTSLVPAGLIVWFIAHLIASQRKERARRGTASTIPLWPQRAFSSLLCGDKWEMSHLKGGVCLLSF